MIYKIRFDIDNLKMSPFVRSSHDSLIKSKEMTSESNVPVLLNFKARVSYYVREIK